MRLARQPQSIYKVTFHGASPPQSAPAGRVPRVARLLALAYKIDRMVRDGEIADYAEAARRLGLTRARVSQITGLLLLAPAIQEAVLDLPLVANGRDPISERQLRGVVAETDWIVALIKPPTMGGRVGRPCRRCPIAQHHSRPSDTDHEPAAARAGDPGGDSGSAEHH